MTGKVQPYKAGFGPFPPEIYHVPFPCHCASLDETKKAMEQLFKCDIDPSRVAAIIFEPVQGEGGFNPIQKEAVLWLRQLCDQHGILLIADEVQTGFARTGKMFAMRASTASKPDLITMAKSMAGGTTLSAVSGRQAVMDSARRRVVWAAPTLATRWPIAAVARGAGRDGRKRSCPSAPQILGDRLVARTLRSTRRSSRPAIGRCARPGRDGRLRSSCRRRHRRARRRHHKARSRPRRSRRGLLLLTCGVYGNVIRFLFPLTIEDHGLCRSAGRVSTPRWPTPWPESPFQDQPGSPGFLLPGIRMAQPSLEQRIQTLREPGRPHGDGPLSPTCTACPRASWCRSKHLPDAGGHRCAGFAGPSIWGTGLPRMGARSEYFGRVWWPQSLQSAALACRAWRTRSATALRAASRWRLARASCCKRQLARLARTWPGGCPRGHRARVLPVAEKSGSDGRWAGRRWRGHG